MRSKSIAGWHYLKSAKAYIDNNVKLLQILYPLKEIEKIQKILPLKK